MWMFKPENKYQCWSLEGKLNQVKAFSHLGCKDFVFRSKPFSPKLQKLSSSGGSKTCLESTIQQQADCIIHTLINVSSAEEL